METCAKYVLRRYTRAAKWDHLFMLQVLDPGQLETRRLLIAEFAEDGVFDVMFLGKQVWLCTYSDDARDTLRANRSTAERFAALLLAAHLPSGDLVESPWVESQESVDAVFAGRWDLAIR